jgi:hypothetical protein
VPSTFISQSKPIHVTGDTSITIYYPDSGYFQNSINDIFTSLNKWFKANKLKLNFDKTYFMKFANNKTCIHLKYRLLVLVVVMG